MHEIRRPCAQPGCPALVERGYCPEHALRERGIIQQYDRQRGNSTRRGYGWDWRRFRKWFLAQPEHAVCEDCHRQPATEPHHIKKVRKFPHLRLDPTNCRGLCKGCHSARTLRGE